MKKIIALCIAASFSAIAFAAPETYVIDTNHTKPRLEYNYLGFSDQESRFDTVSGSITIDLVAKTGSVDITIDANSFDSGYPVFNGHLKGEDFFDTEKYPTITYKADKFRFDGDKLVGVDGDLTIKGITKPVTLTITSMLCKLHPMVKKDSCGANAVAHIKRSDFNMGKYVPAVSDEVTLSIPVESIKQ